MTEPTIGSTLVALGDLLQEVASARRVLEIKQPSRRDPDAVARLEDLDTRLRPEIKAHRDFLARHLIGLGPGGTVGAPKRPHPGTVGDQLVPIIPSVVEDSNAGVIQMFGHLRPTFYLRIFPRDRPEVDRPYLHLALASEYGEPWALHWGFTCFRTAAQERGDVNGNLPGLARGYSRGQLLSLQRVAADGPGQLLEAFKMLQSLQGPGETQAVPNMSAFDTHMPIETEGDVRAWLIGERAHDLAGQPGLIRRIDGGTPAARKLAETSDQEIRESMGRFLQGCAHHFVVPTWERGHLSATPSAFISYRRGDDSAELAKALERALHARGHEAFLDIARLKTGDDWELELQRTIESSHTFVALAGRDYFERMQTADGTRDVVEMELATGLLAKRPVRQYLLNGLPVPEASDLPKSVRGVLRHNVEQVTITSVDAAAERIADDIVSSLQPRGEG